MFLGNIPSSAAPIAQTHASATTEATTTNTGAPVLLNAMTLTPGEGTYLMLFSASLKTSSNNNGVTITPYVGGAAIPEAVATFFTNNNVNIESAMTHAVLVVGAGQAVEIRWHVTGATGSAFARYLTLIKLV